MTNVRNRVQATREDRNSLLEARAQFLARQSVSQALDARESWYADGHLDYDMFADLLADALMETVLRPLLLGNE